MPMECSMPPVSIPHRSLVPMPARSSSNPVKKDAPSKPGWLPKKGEMVFTGPSDLWHILHRLEAVTEVSDSRIKTASGREFTRELVSTIDSSVRYGRLFLTPAPPGKIESFKQWQLRTGRRALLEDIEWPELIKGLDDGGVTLLHDTILKLERRERPAPKKAEPVKDLSPVEWFYLTGVYPAWLPPFTTHLIRTVDEDIYAVTQDGEKHLIEFSFLQPLLKHGLAKSSYALSPELELKYDTPDEPS